MRKIETLISVIGAIAGGDGTEQYFVADGHIANGQTGKQSRHFFQQDWGCHFPRG